MRYLSLCSGIEAASVAWQPLGWEAVAFAEIEPFPCAVLAHHYPDVLNLGDITQIDGRQFRGTVDLVVAGTPCQDFSIAGKRAGMAGERSGLAREFIRLVREVRPQWIVWENVPGVFSTNEGRDFGAFIKALDDSGYCCAWRVLDAQFFGVPQRRRRVFVVGYSGDWRPAATVLFESESVRGDFTQGRKKRKDIAGTIKGGSGKRGWDSNASERNTPMLAYAPPIVEQAISCKWAKGSSGPAGDEHHNLIAFHGSQDPDISGSITHPLGTNGGQECCVAIQPNKVVGTLYGSGAGTERTSGQPCESDMLVLATQQGGAELCSGLSPAITAAAGESGNNQPVLFQKSVMQIRRLTPRECERLMGFPDDYTAIEYRGKPAPDSARYKALGNSMAVPVMRWIGKRIDAFCNNTGVSNG